jgi:two-component system, NtrC family, response regulator AtoC
LVVDDEPMVREALRLILKRNYGVSTSASAEEALNFFEQNKEKSELPDLVLLDVVLPGLDGIGLLEKLRTQHPTLPVVMLTGTANVKSAVKAMKIGAVDYLSKPFEVEELLSLIEKTVSSGIVNKNYPAKTINQSFQKFKGLPQNKDFGAMVGKSPEMLKLFKLAKEISNENLNVLIEGETGTGKELLAYEIHRNSFRQDKPFEVFNCATISRDRIESELFGHLKGSLSYANSDYQGWFQKADGGTLVIDNVSELSDELQGKLLQFLESKQFSPVGSGELRTVDVRILATNNQKAEELIESGKLRKDLYYRLNVVKLEIPPLRERRQDIRTLVGSFISRFLAEYKRFSFSVTEEVLVQLEKYDWPGNVRELENLIESLIALTKNEEATLNDLPKRFQKIVVGDSTKQVVSFENFSLNNAERRLEREMIVGALEKSNYVQTKAAKILGISRRILKYKMDKLGVTTPDKKSTENK